YSVLFNIHSVPSFATSDYFIYENRLLSTFGVAYLIGWDNHLGEAIRHWPWQQWNTNDNSLHRYTDLHPTAILGGGRWNSAEGLLCKTTNETPVLVFSVPSNGIKAYRCRFNARAQDICNADLGVMVVAGEKRKHVVARHAIGRNYVTHTFSEHQFEFVSSSQGKIEFHFYTHSDKPFQIKEIIVEEIGLPRGVPSGIGAMAEKESYPYNIIHNFAPKENLEETRTPNFCIVKNNNAAKLAYLASNVLPVADF
ncbi:unnamed protein product, partial [marine sediment metagenome]